MAHHITGGVRELTDILNNVDPTAVLLIDFYAQWCSPCRAIAPRLDTLVRPGTAQEGAVILMKVDVDEPGNEDLVADFQISAMPTFVWFKGGKIVNKIKGANWEAILQTTQHLSS